MYWKLEIVRIIIRWILRIDENSIIGIKLKVIQMYND
jgi:hypothetical protein